MSSTSTSPALEPPPRQLTPSVKISDDAISTTSSRRTIKAYFSNLSIEQASILSRVLAQIPAILEGVRNKHLEQTRTAMREAFELSIDTINKLNAQAWATERWHEAVLRELSYMTLTDAAARCELGPWDARLDLLVLAHQGRSHVPAFQFDSNGAPAAAWITLIAELRRAKPIPADWDILAWLLRPHPLLNGCAPLHIQATNPQRVRQLAYANRREHLL
jgi:hypothetical protein